MATFGDFTEVTPIDSLFVTPADRDFWVITTAPSDYDNDGDLDIAVLGYYVVYNQSVDYRLMLMRNDGPAGTDVWTFTSVNVPLGGLSNGESDLAWGDLDGDGDQDLAMGTDGYTVIYRNDAGILNLIETNLPAYWEENDQADFDLRSITWADFDNDGDLDLLVPSVYDESTSSYYTALMQNEGPEGANGWNFTSLDNVFAPTLHAQSSWADFDNDQDLDLLLVNIAPLIDDSFIRRYRNDGNGVFTGEDILGTLAVEHGEAQWGDYDGDGDLDILVAGNVKEADGTYTPMALRIYRNDNENYSMVEVIADPAGEGWFDFTAATWADYDSDGDMDILLAGNYNSGIEIEGRARVYSNTDGIFTDSGNELPSPRASGDRGGTFSWFDLDGEGDLDYFVAGQYFVTGGNGLVEAQMHVYRNDVTSQNIAPSTPTDLTASLVDENGVQLSWLAAYDDHTPVSALTYELELFLNNVPVTIPARLPQPGNVSAVTDWFLTGLEDGYYEWTLRSVDAAYIGSTVATGNFIIGNQTATKELENAEQSDILAQNYPNPFSSKTSIHFTVPETENISIKVFDVLGNEIKTLVDKEFTQGLYNVEFDASGISPGVYFYRMTTGGKSVTKKMQVR
jgi:ribosomal protein L30E